MNALRLLKSLWRALPLSDSNRWKLTVLLLKPVLPFIKDSMVHKAYLEEMEWRRKCIRPFSGDPFPCLHSQEALDVFFWGVIDWSYRIQRPQHLARGFAERGHRVFYISPSFVKTTRPGFELESMDSAGRIYNIRIHLGGRPMVYAAPPNFDDMQQLKASVATLLEWTESHGIVSIVQHPYWYELVRKLPDSRLIYDCIDHHDGFVNTGEGIADLELAMLKNAELVVTTSLVLHDIAAAHNTNVVMVRNAAEYDFFSTPPQSIYRDVHGRKVIGYYGAIAEWIDVELLARVAQEFPDCLLLLVGAAERGVHLQLADLPNVVFTGEVKYAELPHYLYGMNVCMLPFRIVPLTLATNPVKVYEYLSAGKLVVAVKLPEMSQFESVVAVADGHDQFIAKLGDALARSDSDQAVSARKAFAAMNTWHHRVDAFEKAVSNLPEPLISVIVITYNNLDLTRACLNSIACFSDYGNFEIIVVDNASGDGSPEFLKKWSEEAGNHRLILNRDNMGFAAANNQGLKLAQGEYCVLLNNDTEVTSGWLRGLMKHLSSDSTLGMVGPVTDNIGNEACIKLHYANPDEMWRRARSYTLRHMGETFPMRTLAFFCVMIPRRVFEKVGFLDEAFGLGFFEDDDYCRRVEQAGWRMACAEDVFIHHHLSASFRKLGAGRQELMEKNLKIYEAKWGKWIPHQRR